MRGDNGNRVILDDPVEFAEQGADSSSESSSTIFPIRARPAPNLGPRLGESVKNRKVCKRCQTASKVPRNGGDRHLGLDFDDFDTLERNRPNFCDHTRAAVQVNVAYSCARSTMPASSLKLIKPHRLPRFSQALSSFQCRSAGLFSHGRDQLICPNPQSIRNTWISSQADLVNRDRLKISLLPAPVEVRRLLFRSRPPRSRTLPDPPVLSGRDQAPPTPSMISQPLRAARCRESTMRLWQ